MPTTSNFGWTTPADTDLVKDGALAIRTLGNGIDTSMAQLKGGTTGQVLSKTSNTDMAFTWVTQDDANAIQNAIVDAKGDLIAATANDTPARLAVGNNGETLVADSSASTGLRWQNNFAAGKNAIINGDFRIAQRGTSFSNPANAAYTLDRWQLSYDGTGATQTISQQSFTPGIAPVAGYEGANFFRWAVSVNGSGNTFRGVQQKIEDVRTFAGQTVTISFWAKADASRTLGTIQFSQDFGVGGSSTVFTTATPNTTALTTSWQRITATVSIPSISGKTVGTSSSLILYIGVPTNVAATTDLWGVQVEAGSVATAFQTATGTLAGEFQACQRYFQVIKVGQAWGTWYSTTDAALMAGLPVPMRVTPTATFSTNYTSAITEIGVTDRTPSSYAAYKTSNQAFSFLANGMTTSATVRNGAVYIGADHQLSAEL